MIKCDHWDRDEASLDETPSIRKASMPFTNKNQKNTKNNVNMQNILKELKTN